MVMFQYDLFIVFGCMMILQENPRTLEIYLRLWSSGSVRKPMIRPANIELEWWVLADSGI
jgi:hypothetical protein